jgi:peptide/nickel transport system substrate-binding protein
MTKSLGELAGPRVDDGPGASRSSARRRAPLWCGLALCSTLAAAEDGQIVVPQYGGTLNLGTVYVGLTALSFDPADWNWKVNHDAGMMYELLFAADLQQSVGHGGRYGFQSEGWLPPDAIRGELAESWEWEDPLTLVVHLRRGVRFTGKPGIMAPRELDAADVVWNYERVAASPKATPGYFDHIDRVEARDPHTVVYRLKEYNAEWDLRTGYGYYSAILPRELAAFDTRDWRNLVGTGPFLLTRFVEGSSSTYERNPDYWDREMVGGKAYPIPFVDRVIYRTIKDGATQQTALRTGKIDILEVVPWLAVDYLKETTPELQWARYLGSVGQFVALRVDREPFDDVRVRRALNMAIDKKEIVEHYYGGNAELFGYPMHPDFEGYFQPLAAMPESVKELFTYDPVKAKRLLAEAGYPDGFRFPVQFAAVNNDHADLLPLIAGYLARVGVTVEIQPLEYAAFLSAMTSKTHAAGYLAGSGVVNPTTSLRKSFRTGQTWNPSMWSDPDFDRRIGDAERTRDETERQRKIKQLTVEMLDQAPYIWLPTVYNHIAWWPWVKNYGGELRAAAVRPAPIYARIWIDHELKRKLGF